MLGNHDSEVLMVKKLIASAGAVIYMTQMWSLVRIERKGGARSYPSVIKLIPSYNLKYTKNFTRFSKAALKYWSVLSAVKSKAFRISNNTL